MSAVATEKPLVVGGRNDRTGGDTTVAVTSHVLLVAWSVVVIVPFAWVFLSSFKTSSEYLQHPLSLPKHWSLDNYKAAWTTAHLGEYFFNSVMVVVSALILVMLLGAMCAYVLARFKFFGRRFIYYLMLAGLTVPPFLAIVPLFFLLEDFGLLNTRPGLILVYVAFALPFTVFFLYSFFRSLPDDVYEAAQIDGASEWRTFFQIMLPMAGPGMASVAIFNFLGLWNQFLLPTALNSGDHKVLTQGLAKFASSAGYNVNFGALFAAVVMTVAPVLVVYVIFQRRLTGSVSQGTFR